MALASVTTADALSGRGDPEQKYRIYRLCVCEACEGTGKVIGSHAPPPGIRCPGCRGEGKTLDNLANCATPAAVGLTLVTLAEEGEFDGCPMGLLEDGVGWLIKPWLPSPRNVSDAARVLANSKTKGEK